MAKTKKKQLSPKKQKFLDSELQKGNAALKTMFEKFGSSGALNKKSEQIIAGDFAANKRKKHR